MTIKQSSGDLEGRNSLHGELRVRCGDRGLRRLHTEPKERYRMIMSQRLAARTAGPAWPGAAARSGAACGVRGMPRAAVLVVVTGSDACAQPQAGNHSAVDGHVELGRAAQQQQRRV